MEKRRDAPESHCGCLVVPRGVVREKGASLPSVLELPASRLSVFAVVAPGLVGSALEVEVRQVRLLSHPLLRLVQGAGPPVSWEVEGHPPLPSVP